MRTMLVMEHLLIELINHFTVEMQPINIMKLTECFSQLVRERPHAGENPSGKNNKMDLGSKADRTDLPWHE